jgi:two-component system, OmpR family, sensor kinase
VRSLSFRTRLTLLWTLSFAVILAAALGAVYVGARRSAYADLDAKLRTLAATELVSGTDYDRGGVVHLHEVGQELVIGARYEDKFVQVLAADGAVVVASKLVDGVAPLVPDEVRQRALDWKAPVFNLTVKARPGRMAVLRGSMGSETYLFAVGLFTDSLEASLQRLAELLGVVWASSLIFTAGVGYALASRALRPVLRITERARVIARGAFSTRLDAPAVDDEIGQMTRLLNEMLESLEGAIEVNRRFAADASHELRTPVTAIRGEVDVILKRERTAAEYRASLEAVGSYVGRMTELIESLMFLVRAQEGRSSVDLQEISLTALLRECAAQVAPLAVPRDVTLRFESFPDLVAYADPRLLGRVFDNLLRNAVNYNRTGGLVTVTGEARAAASSGWASGTVIVGIHDTGTGVPAESRDLIFERFYRAERSRSRNSGGAGLGLAICREVIGLMDGEVRLVDSSEAGSVFEVRLPGRRRYQELANGPMAQAAAPGPATDG